MKIIYILCTYAALAPGLARAGESYEQLEARHQSELQELNSRYSAQGDALNRDYAKAYQAYLRKKGPYPAEYSKRYLQLDQQRTAETKRLRGLQLEERKALDAKTEKEKAALAGRLKGGGSGAGASREAGTGSAPGAGGRSSASVAPKVRGSSGRDDASDSGSSGGNTVDLSQNPKEIHFPGPAKKPARGGKKE